jgi:hypothetical protein
MKHFIILIFALLVLHGCAHKKPLMEGCKKLDTDGRDWYQCEKQVD